MIYAHRILSLTWLNLGVLANAQLEGRGRERERVSERERERERTPGSMRSKLIQILSLKNCYIHLQHVAGMRSQLHVHPHSCV